MIVLIGFMGAGKTTVGQLLAGKLGLPFVDTDLVIEQRTGRSVADIFAADGEPAFRELERAVTAELLAGPDTVLALGGGAVQHPGTQQALRGHRVVYLEVGYPESMRRVAHDGGRPMLRDPGLMAIYQRRLASYQAVATEQVTTGGRPPDAICLDVLARLGGECSGGAEPAAPSAPGS
ncbi:MAG: shikimate kinase [Streptosporangiaceae bacterium]